MNVLISGLSGFIGRNLHRFLSEHSKSIRVYGFVRNEVDCKHLLAKPTRCLTHVDSRILDQFEIDVIIHLAGIAHDLSGKFSVEDYENVNFHLTKHLYQEFCVAKYTSKFVFISSVKALADDLKNDILTERTIPSPDTPYGKSKLKAEQYILSHPHDKKSSYILRPSMVYGPENKGNLNTLHRFISKGYPYPFGAFENKRSFLSVNNLSFIILEILSGKVVSGDYNCSDSLDLSSVDLVRFIAEALNKKVKVYRLNTSIVRLIAFLGSLMNLPFNKKVLHKLTGSYQVSSQKILDALGIEELPFKTKDELIKTIKSFENS
ncbi:MAG: NAD-dependent epimerase/dehydratase family protein [Bacteroidota bacterium]